MISDFAKMNFSSRLTSVDSATKNCFTESQLTFNKNNVRKMKIESPTSPKQFSNEDVEIIQRISETNPTKRSNFSIDFILSNEMETTRKCPFSDARYDWLNYTRYRPPKLQRIRKKDRVQKRRLGRNPRIPFSAEQVTVLEKKFQISPYLSNADVTHLSKRLQLAESRVKIWFQNRRAREKRDSQDASRKGTNVIKNFIVKTRYSNCILTENKHDFSASAFKPSNSFYKQYLIS